MKFYIAPQIYKGFWKRGTKILMCLLPILLTSFPFAPYTQKPYKDPKMPFSGLEKHASLGIDCKLGTPSKSVEC